MPRPAGKSPEIRDRILAAAMGCFETHGFEATTMSMVVEASGVARATVYGHFTSKDELASAAARVQLDALIQAAPKQIGATGLAGALKSFNRASRTWLRKNAALAEVYMRHIQSNPDHSERPDADQPSLRQALRALFTQAAQRGELPESADAQFLADSYALLWFNLCMQWLQQRQDATLDTRLDELVRLFERGAMQGKQPSAR
jgi:AcrR family transcriptional regulator